VLQDRFISWFAAANHGRPTTDGTDLTDNWQLATDNWQPKWKTSSPVTATSPSWWPFCLPK
jgi:hypothetical protein